MKTKRKKLGQIYTGKEIAEFMTQLTILQDTADGEKKRFLDPAVGLGAFANLAGKNPGVLVTACEIDEGTAETYLQQADYSPELVRGDYLKATFEEKFDYIICNPPYNKFQEIENRKKLTEEFEKRYDVRLSGYSNQCIYFLIKSMNELKEGGRCCYIIPYEFLNTGYGKVVKEYLLQSRMLKSIIKFAHGWNLFDEAITTSCILLLENRRQEAVTFISVTEEAEWREKRFSACRQYAYEELDPKEKWSRLFLDSPGENKYRNLVKISTFCSVARGLATGNNEYFVMSQQQAEKLGLSKKALVPCIAKSRHVTDAVITKRTFQDLCKQGKKVYLFDGEKASSPADFAYIRYGEEIGVHKGYLNRHRTPWYRLERKEAAPILMTVFCREGVKVVRNEMGIKTLTTFHGLYLHDTSEEFANLVFCYFLTPLAQELLHRSRREYGIGLDKFEPGDIKNAMMLDLRIISEEDKKRIAEIYRKIRQKQGGNFVAEIETIFRKYVIIESK